MFPSSPPDNGGKDEQMEGLKEGGRDRGREGGREESIEKNIYVCM
jgi:hypothetical protein